MGKTKHRLLNTKEKQCKCGKWFYVRGSQKYCSKECKKKYSRNWGKIRTEFAKLHPNICASCGCDNSGSRFRNCLECRIRYRGYNKKCLEKKKNGK